MPVAIDRFALGTLRGPEGPGLPPRALRQAIDDKAARFTRQGLKPGARVLLQGQGPDLITGLLACWQCGASASLQAEGTTPPQEAAIRDRLRPALIVAGDRIETAAGARGSGGEALVLWTSGTTGEPRGVILSGAAITARLRDNHARIPQAARHRALSLLPPSFGHGLIGGILTPLLGGGEVTLAPLHGIAAYPRLPGLIEAGEIGFLTSVPSLWQILRKLGVSPPARPLARVHVGSAPLDPGLMAWIRDWAGTDEVWDMYGLTETANWTAGSRIAGRFQPWGAEMAVLTETGIHAEGEGEVLIRSDMVMDGYLDQPGPTQPGPTQPGATQPGPTRSAFHGSWLRTGDLGRIAQGLVTLTGRLGTEINRAGVKINPEEVEHLALLCPGVTGAVCFGYPDPVAGEGLALALTGQDLPDRAKTWMRAHLMPDRLPDRWFHVETLPLTPRGKPDRARLRQITMGQGDRG